ncbi:hypothetical protein LLEC1_07341 [Akanthomyces lecanii]|uniref:Uncharacterized protein n=1 Tax=Cordyceps confragosa TaxID=2714763 RepID=A0A179ISC6_CORDF|nr:hypothetical protein LLEC1_07341 [Akanthomyces lecanii]
MFRSMVAGTSTAMIMGLASAIVSSAIWGTAALPFVVFSSVGFAVGSIRWYVVSGQEALLQLQRYPALLRMHVVSNFPWLPEYARHGPAWYTPQRFGAGWVRRSILIASWLSAQPALDEIQKQAEDALVQEYAEARGHVQEAEGKE